MKSKLMMVYACMCVVFLSACGSLPQPSGKRVPINENRQVQEVFKATQN